MPHLIYHEGDRHVPGHPSLDLDIDDAEVVAFLLGGKHSDGSPIWTLAERKRKRKAIAEPATEPASDSPLD